VIEIDVGQILAAVGGALLVGAGLWLWWQQEKKTRDKKKREAEANGWTYTPRGGNLHRKYRHLPFYDGKQASAKHVMRGEFRGRPITMFTFQFREEEYVRSRLTGRTRDSNNDGRADKREVKRLYGVVVVGLPTTLPKFEISATARRRKRAIEERTRLDTVAGDLVGDVVGSAGRMLFGKDYTGSKVETGDQAFDEVFTVRSTEPDQMRALLTPEARSWMLKSDNAKKYVVWCDGEEIITWGTGTDTAIGKVKANYLNDLLDKLPAGQLWGPPPA
jgi:hypothetical protein